jgi:hypothetical protein
MFGRMLVSTQYYYDLVHTFIQDFNKTSTSICRWHRDHINAFDRRKRTYVHGTSDHLMMCRNHFVDFRCLWDHLLSGGIIGKEFGQHVVDALTSELTEADIYALIYWDYAGEGHHCKERASMLSLMGNEAAMRLRRDMPRCTKWGDSNGAYIISLAGFRYVDGVAGSIGPPPELFMRFVPLEILDKVSTVCHNTSYYNLLGILSRGIDSGDHGLPMFSVYAPADPRNTSQDKSVDCTIFIDPPEQKKILKEHLLPCAYADSSTS